MLKVKSYSLIKILFMVLWLKKCVWLTISENIIADEFSLAEEHLSEVEHVNAKLFFA